MDFDGDGNGGLDEFDDVRSQGSDDGVHDMKTWGVAFKWDDPDGIAERVTQSLLLPSGINVKDKGAVEGRVEDNKQETKIIVDLDFSYMYKPDMYGKEFEEYTSVAYNTNHDKMKAWKAAIVQAKGSSSANHPKFVHRESTQGVTVEKDPVDSEGGQGVRAFNIGKKKNPESMAHIELLGETPFHQALDGNECMPEKFVDAEI